MRFGLFPAEAMTVGESIKRGMAGRGTKEGKACNRRKDSKWHRRRFRIFYMPKENVEAKVESRPVHPVLCRPVLPASCKGDAAAAAKVRL